MSAYRAQQLCGARVAGLLGPNTALHIRPEFATPKKARCIGSKNHAIGEMIRVGFIFATTILAPSILLAYFALFRAARMVALDQELGSAPRP